MNVKKRRRSKFHRESVQKSVGGRFDSRCYIKNNEGYSLIELVIVLAIIAAIMGTAFYSIILIFSANAKSTANDIQRSIGDCKVTTMGKVSAYMELYRDSSNENVYTRMYVWDSSAGGGAGDYVPSEPQKVGPKRVVVKYTPETGAEKELSAGSSIQIWFDRSTGGFTDDGSGHHLYRSIRVEGGSKKYDIILTKLTGKSEVKAAP